MKRLTISGAALVLTGVALTGCAKAEEPFKDAPVEGRDDSPAEVIEMPDGFSNIASKCHGTDMVYVVFHGDNKYGSIAISPNSTDCGGTGTAVTP